MIPTSMSDDASIVIGTGIYGSPNLYYTEAGGAVVIGDGCDSGLPAISGDGTTIVGCHLDVNGKENAAKWLGGTSWLDLGTVAGGVSCDAFLSGAYGVNQERLACRRSALFTADLQSQRGNVGPDQRWCEHSPCRVWQRHLLARQRRQRRRHGNRRLAGSTDRRAGRREMGQWR